MPTRPDRHRNYRFGIFELHSSTLELRRDGRSEPRLRGQALQVLLALLERPKEIVTRREIQEKLWPSDTFVDFEHGLNTAINQLRAALGDSAANPRYIQTLPRRGYRFIAPVEIADDVLAKQVSISDSQPDTAQQHNGVLASISNSQSSAEPMQLDAPVVSPGQWELSASSDLPVASTSVTLLLFSLIQVMYLSFYVIALARLSAVQKILAETAGPTRLILVLLVVTAATGIPTRLYLLAAVVFKYKRLGENFKKLFLFLLPVDEMWALAPFLLTDQVGVGAAIAMTAALVYLPFSQRSLLLMTYVSKPDTATRAEPNVGARR